jgi:SARP family transcriptional regulator, regulator of embCAB operon
MKFGVLGPVHVSDLRGRPCAPDALKLRVLLASLLMRRNQVISTQCLTAALWPGEPPKTARTAIQVYISSLRKLLRKASLPDDVARLMTRPPGYVLELDEREFDLSCFEHELDNARSEEEEGEYDKAASRISDALALWRGPALYGVCHVPALEAEARKLDELRMAAFERRILLDLRRGRDHELIGELYSLTLEYPLRENLWQYLIMALHNQGRPADALRAYNTIRLLMRDELGLEPGERLRRLQRAVLSRTPVEVA